MRKKIRRFILTTEFIILGSCLFIMIKLNKYNETCKNSLIIAEEMDNTRTFVSQDEVDQYELQQFDKVYKEYINLIANSFKENGITDFYQIFQIFCQMKNNGYFSISDSHLYGNSYLELEGYLGASMVDCQSVCRDDADFLNDLYHELGFSTSVIDGEGFYLKENNVINHAVCALVYEGNSYLLDATNDTVFIKNKDYYSSYDYDFNFKPNMFNDILSNNKESYQFYLTLDNKDESLEYIENNKLSSEEISSYDEYYNEYEKKVLEMKEFELALRLYSFKK